MSDFPLLSYDGAVDLLISAERPVIVSHARPDGDTLGCAAALCLFYAKMGKPAAFLCADPIPRRLAFLFEGVELAELPEDGEGFYFAVDIASPTQLGDLKDRYLEHFSLLLDHHESGSPFAPYLMEPHAAAAGEVVYSVLKRAYERGLCPPIDKEIATRLYAALSSDSGGFRFPNATPLTHRIAAELLEAGAEAEAVNYALFTAKSPEQLAAERIAMENLHTAADGRISYVSLTRAARAGLADEYFETAVDIARAVSGVSVCFALREVGDGVFRASLRARECDVATVAASFGGGGHLRAAGCTVEAASIEDAAEQILARLIPIL